MQVQKKIKIRPPDESISLLEHLSELRKRLIYVLVAVSVCCIAVYPFIYFVLRDVARPVGRLVFISPLEAFWSRIKLSLFLGFLVSVPFVFLQVWLFVARGLLPGEKRIVLPITMISFLLFLSGAGFCYFLIIPVGVKFLLAYGSDVLVPMISVSRYLSFVFSLVFAFGFIFELPLILGFLVKIGFLQAQTLINQRKLAVIVIFILAAALTPGPDVFSQLLMAGPLLVLYEISILVAKIIERRK